MHRQTGWDLTTKRISHTAKPSSTATYIHLYSGASSITCVISSLDICSSELFSSHGLFTDDGVQVNLQKMTDAYPTHFDSARVLIAEYVAEFSQTGMLAFSELDMERWKYIDHEIRMLIITEKEVATLLRILCKVQKPGHDMCARWKSPTDRKRWREHIQEIYQVIDQLREIGKIFKKQVYTGTGVIKDVKQRNPEPIGGGARTDA